MRHTHSDTPARRRCPRCGRCIAPHLEHPAAPLTVQTFGDDHHCCTCEFVADEFSTEHHEVVA